MSSETIEFQAEARQLLQLMIHSIYSTKDVFLRELISNASDALDKVRLAAFADKDLDVATDDLHITLETDATERTLTVRDNGIGMSRDEVVSLIGTIAKSGTAEMLAQLREAREADSVAAAELIGQFGVGFYASFMVADKVELVTRKAGSAPGVRWESRGEGTYTIEEAPDAPQGTAVTLHLKPEDTDDALHDYTNPATVRSIVKRYSDFITWPIRLGDETVNSRKALWARAQKDVSDEEYAEFYRHVSHDWREPLTTIRLAAEGTFEYQALLFLPSHAPMDLFLREGKRGVQLYVRRVFIMDDCEALVPEYLRFVKGVVDAADLSLNISREILQQDRQIQLIRKRLVKKVLSTVKTMLADEPEKYATFWTEMGRAVKEGLLSDHDNRDAILEICSFPSTHDEEQPTTLRDYLARMPEGQDAIYYGTGPSRSALAHSPHLEAFRAKGYEVLLLTDPVDEVWVDAVPEFEGKSLVSVAKGEVDLGGSVDDDAPSRASPSCSPGWAARWRRTSRRCGSRTGSPTRRRAWSASPATSRPRWRRCTGRWARSRRRSSGSWSSTRSTGWSPACATRTRPRPDDTGLGDTARLLYGMALLAEGGELAEPAAFVALLSRQLEQTLPPA